MITQSFNDQSGLDQYARFMDDLVKLVVNRYDGALKAEHGTGRNMAPFVEAEWGGEAYAIMKRLKELADPESLLNPGVIINSDPKAHLARSEAACRSVEDEVDKCIECGYCEPKCPSRDLTTTPRQRIVVRREMAAPAEWRRRRDVSALAAARSRFPLRWRSTPARWMGSAPPPARFRSTPASSPSASAGIRHSTSARKRFAMLLCEATSRSLERRHAARLRARATPCSLVLGPGAMVGDHPR